MTETWTTRMVVPQWGAGTDAPSRVDFDAAFLNLDGRAAYDDGMTYAAVPSVNLIPGRYARVSTTDGSYSLYRRSATAWEYVGGPVSPVKTRSVALGSQVGTDQAFSLELMLGTPTLWGTYQGDLYANGVLRTNNMMGAAPLGDTLTPATTGRAYVKTQASGDLGLVVRAHATTAGNLFTAREQGGSDIVTIDALGRFQARLAGAFGGATMPTTSTLAISPTTNPSDGVTNGLLLYGQSSVATRALLNAYSFASDTASIATWLTNGMSFGKLPWGTAGASDGAMTLAADVQYFRAIGANLPGAAQYGTWFTFGKAAVSAQSDSTQDTQIFSLGSAGSSLTIPLYLSQENNTSAANLSLYRFTDFTAGRFLVLQQATRTGPTTLTFQLASDWNADGRLRTGVLWKGSGAVRDARQPIMHVSTKVFGGPGGPPTLGQDIPTNTSFTYTFSVMQARSFGNCDLNIALQTTYILNKAGINIPQGQGCNVNIYISVNGGAFNQVDVGRESFSLAAASGDPQLVGEVFTDTARLVSVPNGATFQVRATMNASGEMFLRRWDLEVTECSLEVYAAP
jgi:hypothetical protein